jgi:putative thymidine phosphorylase
MELKIKLLKWSAGIPVAMLNEETANLIGVRTQGRVSIKTLSKNPQETSTIIDTAKTLVKKNEIAVSTELMKRLSLKKRQKVDVNLAPSPQSLTFIKKKMNGETLSQKEISEIIRDVVNNALSEAEIALFISSMHKEGMNMKETIFLINSILKFGRTLKLNLKNKKIVDKHSIGGIAGRTTPIIVSICAVAGLIMPKTSSRAITTPAGTADAMETLAEIDFTMDEIKKIIKKTNACIVWGGGLGMVPADEKIISIEKMLNIDPQAQLLASIMSKKLSVGSKYIVIHIPYGKTAKVNKQKALLLKKKFESLAKHFKIKLKCILVENKGPVGNGIGPALEMVDVIKVLKREDSCYKLEEISLKLSAELLELSGKAKKGKGIELAKQILDSGKAFEKFKEIVKAQKGNIDTFKFKTTKYKKDIFIKNSGKISEIDNKKINFLARIAGCPTDKFAGLYLYKHVGNKLKKREKILTIYAESKPRLREAIKFYKTQKPIKIV